MPDDAAICLARSPAEAAQLPAIAAEAGKLGYFQGGGQLLLRAVQIMVETGRKSLPTRDEVISHRAERTGVAKDNIGALSVKLARALAELPEVMHRESLVATLRLLEPVKLAIIRLEQRLRR